MMNIHSDGSDGRISIKMPIDSQKTVYHFLSDYGRIILNLPGDREGHDVMQNHIIMRKNRHAIIHVIRIIIKNIVRNINRDIN